MAKAIEEKKHPNPAPAAAAAPAGTSAAITAIVTAIVGAIMSVLINALKKAVTGLIARMAMSGFHALVRLAPDEAIKMMRNVTSTFYTPPAEWAAFIGEYIEKMTGATIDYETIARQGVRVGSREAAQAIGRQFLQPMLNLILPPPVGPGGDGRIAPEEGVRAAERYLAANLQFQMSAWLLHLLGDIISFGMWKSLKDLPNAISWSYGLGWLSWLVMGVPFRMTISEPMERYFNRLYRPTHLTANQAVDAHTAGYITREEMVERLRELGYPEHLIPVVMKLQSSKLSESEVKTLVRLGAMGPEDVQEWYRMKGRSPQEAQILAKALIEEKAFDILDDIAKEALRAYVDGALSWEKCTEYLRAARKTQREIELLKSWAELKKSMRQVDQTTEKTLTKSEIGSLFRRRIIDEEEAVSLWYEIGVKEEHIPYLLELYAPPEAKTPEPREIGRSVIGGLYRMGKITEEEAREKFAQLGYSGWRIEYLLRYYERTPEAGVQEKGTSSAATGWWLRWHSEGLVSTKELVETLATRGYAADQIEVITKTLYPAPDPAKMSIPQKKAKLTLRLLREGLITRETARKAFRKLGKSAEEIDAIFDEWKGTDGAKPVWGDNTLEDLVSRVKEGVITKGEALEVFVAILKHEEDARLALEILMG